MGKEHELQDGIVELSAKDGVAFIEQASPLTRLHYFDGKFLRADAFALEQDYHRSRTRLANLAGGWGVVNGLGIALAGNRLNVGAGLAITAAGNFVLASGDFGADLGELTGVATAAPPSGNSEFGDCLGGSGKGTKETPGLGIYEITVGPVEGLCGNEAVYGKLCESACVSSSQHPYWREGVVLRLRPLSLALPGSSAVALGNRHLRNRVASAYFAAEPWLTSSAVNAAGLAGELWCNPANLYGRDEVVIGLLVRDAGINRVIDAWSGRRDRMDTQARGYWQGRMAMRPWNVFVAQILQFQCQLAGVFDDSGGVIQAPGDCDALRQLLDKTRQDIEALHRKYSEGTQKLLRQFGEKALKKDAQGVADQVKLSYAELYDISEQLNKAEVGKGSLPQHRMLLNAGFVELPAAGYLPVTTGKQDLEDQLGRIFGEGVQLHCHAVRHDEIAHLVEEAQHLERISLTRGLDDPTRIEAVEIFVPDGETYDIRATAPGEWWQLEMAFAAMSAFELGLKLEATKTSVDSQSVREQVVKQAQKAEMAKAAGDGGTDAAAAAAAPAAATVAAKLDPAALEEIQARIARLVRSVIKRNLRGLVRTEGRADASYGFTLVATLDADDIVAEIRQLLDSNPEADPDGKMRKQLDAFSGISVYLAGDIAADPFALAPGSVTSLSGEMHFVSVVANISGSLTPLFDRPTNNGGTERIVQLEMLIPTANDTAIRSRGRISLRRNGDSGDGQFVLDDSLHDPSTSPNIFEWQASPRTAAMYVVDEATREAVTVKFMKDVQEKGATGTAAAQPGAETGAAAVADATAAEDVDATRKQQLKMNGLAGMPALDSAIGAAAMNALIRLADTADDPAFLARARRRLFPTLDTPAGEGVRAVLDWVMFRRARSHLCCPKLPTPAVQPAVEAFQVWHLAVADAAALKLLREALDGNDARQLATYKFQRVGVLRFRDENTVAEEGEARVEAMWRQAGPGPQVVLGRHWEGQPSTGQGWQNHFRLRRMLEQISAITAPPLRGDGALAALAAVSPPLADGAMDGGLLVVTLAKAAEAVAHLHRVVMMNEEMFRRVEKIYGAAPADGWKMLNEFSQGDFVRSELLSFADGELTADSATRLRAANQAMRGEPGMHYRLLALRLDGNTLLPGENPTAQHDSISNVLDIAAEWQLGNLPAQRADLGGGAHVLTLVGYGVNQIN